MRPGVVLTDRDRDLLASLAECRFLTAAQIRRLHFPSSETALRRLRRLEGAGLIGRLSSPGLSTQVVMLSPHGAEVTRTSPSPRRAPKALFLEHQIALNDFRIALRLSLRHHPEIELAEFVADCDRPDAGQHQPPRAILAGSVCPGNGGEPIRHIPDGAFVLRRGGQSALFYLEVDRGSETVGNPRSGVGKLLRFYLHLLSQPIAPRLGDQPEGQTKPRSARLLLVTTSRRRIENIRLRWGAHPFQPEIAKRFIWLAPSALLEANDLLREEWCSLDSADDEPYVIARDSNGGASR